MARKRRVEGWALEVNDPEEAMGKSLLQRLGDNNRLWLAAVIALVVVSAALLVQAGHQGSAVEELYSPPAKMPGSSYNDARHVAFAQSFVERKDVVGKVVSAYFAPPEDPRDGDTFVVVFAADTSMDDIGHISLTAAEKNRAVFKTRVRVVAYQLHPTTKAKVRVAVTRWVASRYGFVTTFIRRSQ